MLTKDDKYIILKTKNQRVIQHEEYVNLFDLFTNGKIKLGHAMKKHSGDYLLEEFGSDGVLWKKVNVRLEIQAPVSKPAVSQMCLSPEQMNIRCSSEGDGVEFNWTLNGFLLVPTSQFPSNMTANIESLTGKKTERDKPSVSYVTISFLGQQTGNLMCGVWNNVSRDETVIHLTGCKDFVSSFPVMIVAVTASAVTLLLLVALCLGIIKLHNKPRSTTVNEDNTEEDVIYTTVRIIQNP
ncbi:uncharacterized protein LOC119475485 isoform X2 [Sebastes umbrosus]|uniref:uncharacterized protein LOC119475485 isoform X2 n=1 Tax=Sebastes umbrosus TaxID=72105 RepID=UPI00189F19E7|nr:uncharacterized protein LOC119475485 isoform X2 [Sebastes umbrosus]